MRKEKSSKGNFFQIDLRTWHSICELANERSSINMQVAYLVLGCGTGGDNMTTSWSIHAIEKYTGISRGRAGKAIQSLSDAGFIEIGGTKNRPRYKLKPAYEVNGTNVKDCRKEKLTPTQDRVVEKISKGLDLSAKDKKAIQGIENKGWKVGKDDTDRITIASPQEPEAYWVWLPNELVTSAAGEISPIERIRQTQNPMTLRLYVDMYNSQNLAEDNGVHPHIYKRKFEREKIGEYGQYDIWGFTSEYSEIKWGSTLTDPHRRENLSEEEISQKKNYAIDFFKRIQDLMDLGLVQIVNYVYDSDDQDAEILHPYDYYFSEHSSQLAHVLREAAESMLPEYSIDDSEYLIPALRHMGRISIQGVAVLRYRPKTKRTSVWWSDYVSKCNTWQNIYKEMTVANKQAKTANC